MLKRTITIITLISFVFYLYGCSTTWEIPNDGKEEYKDYDIKSVVTVEGKAYEFISSKNYNPAYISDSLVIGYVQEEKGNNLFSIRKIQIPISQVQTFYVDKFDFGKACFGSLLIVGGIVALAGVLKESCPFIYSFDGEKYVFDGEPYGGAICLALERTDYCLLENLKPFNNQYLLQLTNEVDETQYTNEFKLWVVDHPDNVSIVPDVNGNLYTVKNPFAPLRASSSSGKDLLKWIEAKDLLLWESNISNINANDDSNLRDTLYLTFPKPKEVNKVKLIVNGGTTLWGSQMLKRMTELRGEEVDQWYKALENPLVKSQLEIWNDREELYQLQVKVNSDDKWINKGEIWGGGPFITEDRVVLIDISDIKSDNLKIMISPPKGFWTFNSFAVDYSAEVPFKFQEISASKIISDDGIDLKNVLETSDKSYYDMPDIGQRAYLTFPVPEFNPGYERRVFAKASGYYDIHMKKTGEPQNELIRRIAFEPGFPVKYSLWEFSKWIAEIKKGTASN